MIKCEAISYSDQETLLEGFVAHPSIEKRLPLILLCHAWAGRDNFICEKARQCADLGYVGFALDMYGKGILGSSKEENAALKKPFLNDHSLLQNRLLKGFEAACSFPFVDTSRIVALGYGFGGLCALHLACSPVNLKGAISVYGHFETPSLQSVTAKILILHCGNDTIVPMAKLHAFENQLKGTSIDWQSHIYSHTQHAFVNPASGASYNLSSANRSWQAIVNFLAEVARF